MYLVWTCREKDSSPLSFWQSRLNSRLLHGQFRLIKRRRRRRKNTRRRLRNWIFKLSWSFANLLMVVRPMDLFYDRSMWNIHIRCSGRKERCFMRGRWNRHRVCANHGYIYDLVWLAITFFFATVNSHLFLSFGLYMALWDLKRLPLILTHTLLPVLIIDVHHHKKHTVANIGHKYWVFGNCGFLHELY